MRPCAFLSRTRSEQEPEVKVLNNGAEAVYINYGPIELRFVKHAVDNKLTNLLDAMLSTLEKGYFNGKNSLPKCVNTLMTSCLRKGSPPQKITTG